MSWSIKLLPLLLACACGGTTTSPGKDAPHGATGGKGAGGSSSGGSAGGGGSVCPNPTAQDQNYLEEWNWQSQACIRALIGQLGGQATDERFWIVDMIDATLTWSWIQAVGAHPNVMTIESNTPGGAPPP